GEREDAREDAAVCHRLIAASHSSTQALRLAATSSAENCSVLDGSTSLPNAGSRGLSVLPAGNIQLVSGMTSWNPGPVMKAMNFDDSGFFAPVVVTPATSIWR